LTEDENDMAPRIQAPREQIAAFCQKHRIRRLAFFGSVLRADFGPSSDVDVLVEFAPDAIKSLFQLHDMESELSILLGGRPVEIVTSRGLSRYFRDQVLSEAEVQYVQA